MELGAAGTLKRAQLIGFDVLVVFILGFEVPLAFVGYPSGVAALTG